MKKFYLSLFLFLTLACTSKLDEKTVAAFKGYNIEKFIRERFIDKISLPNKFALFLDKGLPHPNGNSLNEVDEFHKKNFIFKAYFTAENSSKLSMPADDLNLFCKQSGGEFLQTKKFQKDYFVRKDFYPVTYFYAADNKLTSETKIMTYSENLMPSDAKSTYDDLSKRGYFGDFTCVNSGKEIWAVAIHPIGFSSKDNQPSANQLGNANLLLLQIMPIARAVNGS